MQSTGFIPNYHEIKLLLKKVIITNKITLKIVQDTLSKSWRDNNFTSKNSLSYFKTISKKPDLIFGNIHIKALISSGQY